MRRKVSVTLLIVALLTDAVMASGCGAGAGLKSEAHPVELYLAPTVDASVIAESGKAMASFLEQRTGYKFEVQVPDTYSATIQGLGAAEGHGMAVLPAMGYVLAAERYGAQAALAAVRYGWGYFWSQYLVRCDKGLTSLADLEGKHWAYPDTSSASGYLVPASYFKKAGINPGDEVVAGGHPQAIVAVYEGQVDFATTFYSPPGEPGDWKIGDPPQPAGEPTVEHEGDAYKAYAGGLRLRDARTSLLARYPDVIDKVCILAISDPIPNEVVAFSKGFPAQAREKIVQALIDYAATEEGQKVLANDAFYDITGFVPVDDSSFGPVREMIHGLGLTEQDIVESSAW